MPVKVFYLTFSCQLESRMPLCQKKKLNKTYWTHSGCHALAFGSRLQISFASSLRWGVTEISMWHIMDFSESESLCYCHLIYPALSKRKPTETPRLFHLKNIAIDIGQRWCLLWKIICIYKGVNLNLNIAIAATIRCQYNGAICNKSEIFINVKSLKGIKWREEKDFTILKIAT